MNDYSAKMVRDLERRLSEGSLSRLALRNLVMFKLNKVQADIKYLSGLGFCRVVIFRTLKSEGLLPDYVPLHSFYQYTDKIGLKKRIRLNTKKVYEIHKNAVARVGEQITNLYCESGYKELSCIYKILKGQLPESLSQDAFFYYVNKLELCRT